MCCHKRIFVLDDRLLHMARDEAKVYLDDALTRAPSVATDREVNHGEHEPSEAD